MSVPFNRFATGGLQSDENCPRELSAGMARGYGHIGVKGLQAEICRWKTLMGKECMDMAAVGMEERVRERSMKSMRFSHVYIDLSAVLRERIRKNSYSQLLVLLLTLCPHPL